METLRAVCAPGLEPFLARELQALGLGEGRSTTASCGTDFEGTLEDLYRANLHLRTADRVLVKLGAFRATKFPELARKAAALPWERFLSPGTAVSWQTHCRESRLYHERGVSERLVEAIASRLGEYPPVRPRSEVPGIEDSRLIVVRMTQDECSVEIDSSGAPLHRRGWRLATAKAPLKETLASALLMASGWDGASPLLDPFCGSGTIAIEAALMSAKVPPGLSRRFAFMDWPGFDAGAWERLKDEARRRVSASGPAILASDRDEGAVRDARANAERAGASGRIELSRRAVSAVEPPKGPGWVVCNPPYGVRLRGGPDLRDLYAGMGKVLRAKCPGWRLTLICPSPVLARGTGLRFDEGLPMMNGGLKVRAFSALV